MIVMFCGHKEISEPDKLRRWLEETVEALIQRGADTFYLGDYGAFDRLSANVVWSKKRLYPSVQSVLVLPYLDRAVDATDYDGTIYPFTGKRAEAICNLKTKRMDGRSL